MSATMHSPIPGPEYWNYRCLVCGKSVADHPSLWRRIMARIKRITEQQGEST